MNSNKNDVIGFNVTYAKELAKDYLNKGYITQETFNSLMNDIDNGSYEKSAKHGEVDKFINHLSQYAEAHLTQLRIEKELDAMGWGDIWSTSGISIPLRNVDDASIFELLVHNAQNGKLTIGGNYKSSTGTREEKDNIDISTLWDNEKSKLKGQVLDATVSADSNGDPVTYLDMMVDGKVIHIKINSVKDALKNRNFRSAAKSFFARKKYLKDTLVNLYRQGVPKERLEFERNNYIRNMGQNVEHLADLQAIPLNFVASMQTIKPGSDTVQYSEW